MRKPYSWSRGLRSLLLMLVLSVLMSNWVWAQSMANYNVSRTTGNAYTSINATGTSVTSWRAGTTTMTSGGTSVTVTNPNNLSDPVPIGFTFVYAGVPFTTVQVSVEGFITFAGTSVNGTSTLGAYGPDNTWFSSASNYTIAPFYDDLIWGVTNNTPSSCVKTQVTGSAPNRKFIVEWADVRTMISGTAELNNMTANQSFTFQVVLNEATGNIEFNYGNMTLGTPTQSPTYSLGLVNVINTQAVSELKVQNIENTTVFSNSPNNALITPPASFSSYIFTPPAIAPTSPNNGAVASFTSTSANLTWNDNASTETGYAIYRSDDGGSTFNYVGSMPANATTYSNFGLISGTTYSWRVYALNEGQMSSSFASMSCTTTPATTISSTSTGGPWTSGSTWVGGVVPTSTQNVSIVSGATVTINSLTPTCNNLSVDGTLLFDNASNASLDVVGNVQVNAGGTFTSGTGLALTHTLRIGGNLGNPNNMQSFGNLTVNGTFNMATTSTTNIIFGGALNGVISGTGTLNFSTATINKGVGKNANLQLAMPFTVNGGNTQGFIPSSGIANGNLEIAGTFTQSNPLFTVPGYIIPANGSLRLNNPNFTVTGQAGSAGTMSGRLWLTQGTYNIGTLIDNLMNMGTGGIFIMDGPATMNVAGAFGFISSTGTINFTQTSGTIRVATVGNTATGTPSFCIASLAAIVNITGGTVEVVNRAISLATPPVAGIDYWVGLFNAGNLTMTGGTLKLGTASTNPANSFIGVNSVVSGGSGYQLGQVLTVNGGAFSVATTLTVTSIGTNGTITQAMVNNPGAYTTLPTGTVTVSGGTGSGATFTLISGTPFRIRGDIYNLVMDNSTGNKSAILVSQANVRGTTTINPNTALALNGFTVLYSGSTLVNNGILDGYPTGSRLTFSGSANQTYSGSGASSPLAGLSMQNASGLTMAGTLRAQRVNFFTGGITNSPTNNVILGTGNTDVVLQYGNASGATAAGNFSTTPQFNVGTASYIVLYAQETSSHVTGPEVPTTTGNGVYARTINQLYLSNTLGTTLTGGNLIIGDGSGSLTSPPVLSMTGGNINLNGNNLTLGSSAAVPGSMTYSAGFIVGSGSFTRWFSTAQQSAASPVGVFPLGSNTNSRVIYINPATSLSSGGTVSVSLNNAGGLTSMTSFNEVAPTSGVVNLNGIDTRSQGGWIISTGNGLGNGAWTIRATTTNMIQTFNGGDLRLVTSTSANPLGKSTANTGVLPSIAVNKVFTATSMLNNTFHVGTTNSNASAIVTAIASGDWGSGSTWNSGTPPQSIESAVIPSGITVTVQGGSVYNCANLTVDGGGALVNNANTLLVGSNLVLNGSYTQGGGNLAINGAVQVASATIANAGSGYAVNDVVTFSGGTGTFATAQVTAVDGSGGIILVSILNPGNYSAMPSSPAGISGGSGTGATFSLTMNTNAVAVGTTGNFTLNAGNVTLGSTSGGGLYTFQNNGYTGVNGGTLTINGNAQFTQATNSQFYQTGGNIVVDGNNGTLLGSVPSRTDIVAFNASPASIQITGGSMTIVDPPFTGTGNALFSGLTGQLFAQMSGHTLTVGGSTGTNSSTAANGFRLNLGSTSSIRLGNLVVNGGTGNSRFTCFAQTTNSVLGDLTINANSELRIAPNSTSSAVLNVGGNLTNNGTFYTSSSTTTGGLVSFSLAGSPNGVAQTISGSGVFRNAMPVVTVANAGTGYAVGDVLTLAGGTSSSSATFMVTSLNGTSILGLTMVSAGTYTVEPSGTQNLTGGSGSGATATITAGTFIPNATFNNVTFNNNSFLQGVTVNVPSLSASSTLNLQLGQVNLGANSFTLGTSGTSNGTLSITSGYFTMTTGSFTRWYPSTTLTTQGTTTRFPVGNLAGNDRSAFVLQTVAGTAGTVTVRHNQVSGTTTGLNFTDASVSVNMRNNSFWTVSTGNGYANTSASLVLTGSNLFQNIVNIADVRITLGSAAAPGTAASSTGSSSNVVASRTGMSAANLNNTFYLGGNSSNFPVITTTIASGSWNDPAIWDNGVPTSSTDAIIATPYNVSLPATGTLVANNVTVQTNASLTVGQNTLTVGPTNGGNRVVNINGTLNMATGGTFNINGSINFSSSSSFVMTGGSMNIDGNTGTAATSIGATTNMFAMTLGASGNNVSVTGGTITFVDPNPTGSTGSTMVIGMPSGSTSTATFNGSTVNFGDGVSSTTGTTFSVNNGFTSAGITVPLGNVVVRGGTRGTTTVAGGNASFDVNGTMTINSGSTFTVAASTTLGLNGTLTNNGTLVTLGTVAVRTNNGNSPTASTIGGTGTFANLAASPTANFTNFTMNNAAGLTVSSLSATGTGTVSGTFTMTAGDISLGSNIWTVGTTATSIGTFTYTSGYFNATTGGFRRWIGTSTLSSTGSAFIRFPYSFNGNDRSLLVGLAATGSLSAGGTIMVRHTGVTGTTSISPFTDGGVSLDRRSNSGWAITLGNSINLGTSSLRVWANAFGMGAVTNLSDVRLINTSDATSTGSTANGTGVATSPSTTSAPIVQRDFAQASVATLLNGNIYYVGGNAGTVSLATTVYSVASGAWETGSTWSSGAAPDPTNDVIISGSTNVTVNAVAAAANNVNILTNGTLTVSGSTLTIGANLTNNGTWNTSGGTTTIAGTPSNGILNNANSNFTLSSGTITLGQAGGDNRTFSQTGTSSVFNMSGGTLNINGNANFTGSSINVTQSGGLIALDGNANNVALNSVASGTHIFNINVNGFCNFTAGTIRIIDPIVSSYSSFVQGVAPSPTNSIRIGGSANLVCFRGTHTFELGDGLSTTPGNADGFMLETAAAGATTRMPIQNLSINGGNVSGRWTYGSQFAVHVKGNLTINSNSEFRTGTTISEFAVGGNISVGTNSFFTVQLPMTLGGIGYNVSTPQVIQGAGTIRNATSSPTASTFGITINNGGGVTLNTPLIMDASGVLTLSSGIVSTSLTNLLTLRNPFTTAISGGSATSYIKGPVVRRLNASCQGDSTYVFPVGGNFYNPFELVGVQTSNAGTTDIRVSVTDAASGGTPDNVVLGSLNPRYWSAIVTSSPSYFSVSTVRLTDAGISTTNRIARSSGQSGLYTSVSNAPVSPFSNITSNNLTSLGYFSIGSLVNCSGTPTAGTATAANTFVSIGSTTVITVTGNSASNGISYQWETSPDGLSGWANVTSGQNATTNAYTTPALGSTSYYRCKILCGFGGGFSYTNVVTVYVPGSLSYSVSRSTGQAYSSIISNGTSFNWSGTVNTDDYFSDFVDLAALGFNMNYNGIPVTQMKVSTNGFLTFASSNTVSNIFSFTSATATGMLAPFWADMVVSPNNNTVAALQGAMKYQLVGTGSNQTLIVEWANMETFGNAGPNLNFQIRMYEATGQIEYYYGNMIGMDGTANYSYTYGQGMTSMSNNGTGGMFISQQFDNVDNYSNTNSVNNLSIIPVCNSKYTFVPDPAAVLPTNPAPSLAATSNDNCSNAMALTVGSSSGADPCVVYRTTTATPSNVAVPTCSAASASNVTNQRDVWFSFTLTQTSNVTINVIPGGGFDAAVQLLSGNCGSQTSLNCVNAATTGLGEVLSASNLVAGTYYIRVFGASANSTGFFNLGLNATLSAPLNDNCSGPVVLTLNQSVNSGNTAAATASSITIATCAGTALGAGTPDDDVWFTYVATSTTTRFTVTPSATYNPVMQILTGTCVSSGFTSQSCVNSGSTGATEQVTLTTAIGTTYFIRVYHFASGATPNGGFSILVDAPTPACPTLTSPVNNLSNVDATVANVFNWSASTGPGNLTYTFQLSTDPTFATTLVNQTGLTTLSYTLPASTLANSTNYYWRVNAVNGNGASTSCSVRQFATSGTIPSCVTGMSPANASTNQPNSVVLSWGVPSGNPTGYDVYFSNLLADVQNQVVGARIRTNTPFTTYTASGLVSGATYYWKIVPVNSYGPAVGCQVNSFTVQPAAPANDECVNAANIAVNGIAATASPAYATQSLAPCAGVQANDIWFKFTASVSSAQLTVTGNNNYNAVVQVYSGACGSLSSLQCVNSGGNNSNEVVTLSGLTPGSVYYVRVYNFNSGTSVGCTVTATIIDRLTYNGTTWSPSAPSASTSGWNVVVSGGTYAQSSNVSVASLTVNAGATHTIGAAATLSVFGNLTVNGTLTGTGKLSFEGGNQTVSGSGAMNFSNAVYVKTGSSVTSTTNKFTLMSSGYLMHGTGTTNGGGSFSGNMAVRQTGTAGTSSTASNNKYNFWSTPVLGGTYANLGIGVRTFNAATQSWSSILYGNTALSVGKGYLSMEDPVMSTQLGTGVRQFTGNPNSGLVNSSLSYLGANNGWNLIGNPYPGAIDGQAFLSANTQSLGGSNNINGAVYLWNNALPNPSGSTSNGDFVTRNAASGAFNIAKAQGFFVEATQNGSAVFNNSMRTEGTATFLRTSAISRLTLGVDNHQDDYNTTLVAFTADASDAFDVAYDAPKWKGNANLALYTKLQNQELAIQSFGEITGHKVIPVGVDAGKVGTHTLSIESIEGIDATTGIFLQDVTTGVMHNLRSSGYNFSVNTAGSLTNRFYIHIQPLTTGVQTNVQEKPNFWMGKDVVRITGIKEATRIKSISILDASGRRVFSDVSVNTSNMIDLNVSLPAGVYMIQVETNQGVFTEKVVKSAE